MILETTAQILIAACCGLSASPPRPAVRPAAGQRGGGSSHAPPQLAHTETVCAPCPADCSGAVTSIFAGMLVISDSMYAPELSMVPMSACAAACASHRTSADSNDGASIVTIVPPTGPQLR